MLAHHIAAAGLGFGLIALGLMAGPLAALKRGLEEFQLLLYGIRRPFGRPARNERLPGQMWVAVFGGVLLLAAWGQFLAG